MKNLSLIIAMIFVLLLVGCNGGEEKTQDDTASLQQMIGSISKSEAEEKEEVVEEQETKQPSVFASTLEDIFYNHKLPDGTVLDNLDTDEQLAENNFAIYDIDFDGKEELIFSYNSGSMADICDMIFDYDPTSKTIKEEARFSPTPGTKYYDDGIVYENWLHNQGGEDPWPYNMYKYNTSLDKYETIEKQEVTGNEINIPFQTLTKENIDLIQ